MRKQHHKPVLFDKLLAPSKETAAIQKIRKSNRRRFLLFGVFRTTVIVIGSILGSLAFTIAINALVQERNIVEIALELWDKILNLVG